MNSSFPIISCLFVAGPGAMMRSAAVGGILLGLIEGVGILITKMTAEQFKPGSVAKLSQTLFVV